MSASGPACSTEELLTVLMARKVRDWETCACGALSQVPAAALLLAEAMHAPNIELLILGSRDFGRNMGRDIHFLTQRGEMDLFFHSAIQFDGDGNFNLHVVGDPDAPEVRFPGGYGSGLMSYTSRRIFFFRTEHSRRTFVPKVDFISGAAKTPPGIRRPQEPIHVFTPMAIMRFDRDVGRYTLESAHEGFTPAEVQEQTGFELVMASDVPVTPPPGEEELRTLRTVVRDRMVETGTYGEWALENLRAPATA